MHSLGRLRQPRIFGSTALEVPLGPQRSGPALPVDTQQIDGQQGRRGGAWLAPAPASRLVPQHLWAAAHRLALQPPQQPLAWRHNFNGHCPHVRRCSNASLELAMLPTSPERHRRLLLSHGMPLPKWAVAQRPCNQTQVRHPKGSGLGQLSDARLLRPWPHHNCTLDGVPAPRGLALLFHGATLPAGRHNLPSPGLEPIPGMMGTRLQRWQTVSHGCAQIQHHRLWQKRPTASCARPPHPRWQLGQRRATHCRVQPRRSRP
mmetsp:Transcript_77612/g.153970  ORF Transcript_77612/g.153970 Transcript_77612/m.153970 type:complete len:261 (-) Transcript_77612:354-1136(-)